MASRAEYFGQKKKIASSIKAGTAVASTALTLTGGGALIGAAVSAAGQGVGAIVGSGGDSFVGKKITTGYDAGNAGYDDSFFSKKDQTATYGGTGTMSGLAANDMSNLEKIMMGVEVGAGITSVAGNAAGTVRDIASGVKALSNVKTLSKARDIAGKVKAGVDISKNLSKNLGSLASEASKAYGMIATAKDKVNNPEKVNYREDAMVAGMKLGGVGIDYLGKYVNFNK